MKEILRRTEEYLNNLLIPFWVKRAFEPKFGGFQTNYDRNGKRTIVTEKAQLAQGRCIFALSHILRSGFYYPGLVDLIGKGINFLFKYYKDSVHGGYYWIVSEDGKPIDNSKVVYGHSFLIYGLAEYALLTGNKACREEAVNIVNLLDEKAADKIHGGYNEHFDREFKPMITRTDGIYHKSLDVHMHLMEAFTTLYELTGEKEHRAHLENIIQLIFEKMTDPSKGTGISMFTADWNPIPNAELKTIWGHDRFKPKGKPVEITSYGHNIELGWLYLHALDILGIKDETSRKKAVPFFEHAYKNGVDWEYGGLFVEGYREGEVTETNKEFWQQAEAMVGFLDAYILTRDEKYLDAFKNVHNFVFTKMINWDQGEWFPLLDRQGNILSDQMGYNWKSGYHTLRATSLIVKKLREIINKIDLVGL
jgi:mannobiose 2-epimerase